ncbi:hypothetical protein M3Y99_00128700 [Aphelenchoides fujianensis]|nr:hypothetical protein M3Y99_00128700 [Aphelenchoides fujianensis]
MIDGDHNAPYYRTAPSSSEGELSDDADEAAGGAAPKKAVPPASTDAEDERLVEADDEEPKPCPEAPSRLIGVARLRVAEGRRSGTPASATAGRPKRSRFESPEGGGRAASATPDRSSLSDVEMSWPPQPHSQLERRFARDLHESEKKAPEKSGLDLMRRKTATGGFSLKLPGQK